MNGQVVQELRTLVDKMSSMTVTPKAAARRRRRQRRRQRKAVVAPLVQAAVTGPTVSRRRRNMRRRGANGGNNINVGAVTVSRREMFVEVTGGDVKVYIFEPSNFTWLANLSKSFDRLVWVRAHLYFKSAVGTTTNGMVAYGMDWNFSNPSFTNRKTVLACTPVADHPVWQSTEDQPLILPPNRLMSRREYLVTTSSTVKQEDRAPGYLLVACSSDSKTVVGEIWVDYTVQLFGTSV